MAKIIHFYFEKKQRQPQRHPPAIYCTIFPFLTHFSLEDDAGPPHLRVQTLNGGTTLMIKNAQTKDIGTYRCQVHSQNESISSRPARVRFYRGRAKPSIIHSPSHTEIQKGTVL